MKVKHHVGPSWQKPWGTWVLFIETFQFESINFEKLTLKNQLIKEKNHVVNNFNVSIKKWYLTESNIMAFKGKI